MDNIGKEGKHYELNIKFYDFTVIKLKRKWNYQINFAGFFSRKVIYSKFSKLMEKKLNFYFIRKNTENWILSN